MNRKSAVVECMVRVHKKKIAGDRTCWIVTPLVSFIVASNVCPTTTFKVSNPFRRRYSSCSLPKVSGLNLSPFLWNARAVLKRATQSRGLLQGVAGTRLRSLIFGWPPSTASSSPSALFFVSVAIFVGGVSSSLCSNFYNGCLLLLPLTALLILRGVLFRSCSNQAPLLIVGPQLELEVSRGGFVLMEEARRLIHAVLHAGLGTD
jgi:hypothetical protein